MPGFEFSDNDEGGFAIPASGGISIPFSDDTPNAGLFPNATGKLDGDEVLIEKLWEELLYFNRFWDRILIVLEPCEIVLLALGFLGNLLALITLLHSKRMNTPSFLYHRVLVGADLLFCTNFFLNLLIDRLASVDCKHQIFRYWPAAFYSAVVYPCVNSICSYVLSYITIAVTLDRLLALSLCNSYRTWNRRGMAISVIAVSSFLSISLHSWSAFIKNTVIEYRLDRDTNDTTVIWQACWTERIVYHWVKRDQLGSAYDTAFHAKGIYNAVFRITYSLLLVILTLGVAYGLANRWRRKRRLTCRPKRGGGRLLTSAGAQSARRQERCERALLILTVAVLVLAFLQVTASEGRRILQFAYPADKIIRTKVDNPMLPMEERLSHFRWVLYAHQATRALANLFTVIERSALCFLYVTANKLFRGEMMVFLSAVFLRGNEAERFRQRFDSDARCLKRGTLPRDVVSKV